MHALLRKYIKSPRGHLRKKSKCHQLNYLCFINALFQELKGIPAWIWAWRICRMPENVNFTVNYNKVLLRWHGVIAIQQSMRIKIYCMRNFFLLFLFRKVSISWQEPLVVFSVQLTHSASDEEDNRIITINRVIIFCLVLAGCTFNVILILMNQANYSFICS